MVTLFSPDSLTLALSFSFQLSREDAACLSGLEDVLSCPISCEIFTDPVNLYCSHSFCRTCLEATWKQGGTQDCPVCRQRLPGDKPPASRALRKACETPWREKQRRDGSRPKRRSKRKLQRTTQMENPHRTLTPNTLPMAYTLCVATTSRS
uniref:RING-type domain-containing protein n=1 Tax=Oncorhynchus mykiss TaxID=8022 RepID=A0A8K9V579_ONCMY